MSCSTCGRDGIITNDTCQSCQYTARNQSRPFTAHDLAIMLITVKVLEHKSATNADKKTPQRFTITSVKTWKKDNMRIHIGLKRGQYQNESIDSLSEFFLHFNLPSSQV